MRITFTALAFFLAASVSALALAPLEVANQIRRDNHLPEFTADASLTAAAQGHAEDMVRRRFFDHTNPDGLNPGQRMRVAGASFRGWGENIAYGVKTPEAAFQMWLNSPGHRANLLNKNYSRCGIGAYNGYWVHDFAD